MARVLPQHLSPAGARFIARWEGMVLHPYDDPAGYATIGIGHLLHRSRVTIADVRRWRRFKRTDAYALLQADAEKAARAVRAIQPPIRSQSRFDALVSLAFNLGPGILGVDHTVGQELRKPGRGEAADAILLYDHAGSRRLPGLTLRRAAERRLFLTGSYL